MKGLVRLALQSTTPGGGALAGLDPRTMLLALGAVLLCLLSHGKYELAVLVPYALFPLLLIKAGGGAVGPILARLVLMSPFALLLGILNPLFDTRPLVSDLGLVLPGGWVSFAAIILRYVLCLGSVLAVAATLPLANLCRGARRLGLPRALTMVVLLLVRYLQVLVEEGRRLGRAREARASGRLGWRSGGGALGNLVLRTLDRSGRIQGAMAARGFDRELPVLAPGRWTSLDSAFLILVVTGAGGWRLLSLAIDGGGA